MVQRSASTTGLIPRAPTGSDWGRSNPDDSEVVGLTEMLKDLDRQAGYVCFLFFLSVVCSLMCSLAIKFCSGHTLFLLLLSM